MRREAVVIAVLTGLGILSVGLGTAEARVQAGGQPASGHQAEKPPLYDEKADAKALIAEAVKKASADNKRVLVMFGGNWCGWCHKLHATFESDPQVKKALLYEYVRVNVDIGKWDKHMDLAEAYGAKLKDSGVPFLTVLDGSGKVVANQETGSLEEGDHHVPAKVLGFLNQWKAPPQNADDVLKAGLSKAKAESKKVLVYFSAPWCGWCHRMTDWLTMPEVAATIGKAYVPVKIDVDRMTGGKELDYKYRGSDQGGIPFFAVLDAEGVKLADANHPEKGNVGFPAAPHEIEHFIAVVKQTGAQLSESDVAALRKSLESAKP